LNTQNFSVGNLLLSFGRLQLSARLLSKPRRCCIVRTLWAAFTNFATIDL